MKFCTISGTTPDKLVFKNDEKNPDFIQFKFKLTDAIFDMYKQGITDFICNCEIGVHLWSAEIVLAMKRFYNVRLNIAVPFKNQAQSWDEDSQDRYYDIYSKADSVILLNTKFTSKCYDKCDKYMIDNSDMLLLADKNTPYIQKYAEKKHKPIFFMDADEFQI